MNRDQTILSNIFERDDSYPNPILRCWAYIEHTLYWPTLNTDSDSWEQSRANQGVNICPLPQANCTAATSFVSNSVAEPGSVPLKIKPQLHDRSSTKSLQRRSDDLSSLYTEDGRWHGRDGLHCTGQRWDFQAPDSLLLPKAIPDFGLHVPTGKVCCF